jgi:hypothetical protein
MRTGYEWENKINTATLQCKAVELQAEIKRISTFTLRQNFTIPSDRQYWVEKLSRLNGQLSGIESMMREGV